MLTIERAEFERNPSQALDRAVSEELVITENGKPKFQVYSFEEEAADEQWEGELLRDPRFNAICERSKAQIDRGEYTRLEDLEI